MLERIDDTPSAIEGFRAIGKVSKDDYETVLEPVLRRARENGTRIRFLYEIGAGFDGFTAAGAWEDAKLGLRYLTVFEACAVVSDIGWTRETARAIGIVLPCPVRVFASEDRDQAVSWLVSLPQEVPLAHRVLPDRNVVVLEVTRALRPEDFDALARTVDELIREHGQLQGLVVHAREFPGWGNFAGFLRHIAFIREHHRKIAKIALAADARLASLAPRIAKHFVEAQIRRFEFDALDQAIERSA
jgi:hypothetical protein